MSIFKRLARLHRLALLIPLLVCVSLTQVMGTIPAFATDSTTLNQEQSQEGQPPESQEEAQVPPNSPTIELVKPLSPEAITGSTAPFVFLYAPSLTWNALDTTSAGPLTRLLDASAIGNLSAPRDWGISSLLQDSRVGIYTLSAPTGFSAAAATINNFIERELPANALLIIVSAPLFDGGTASRDFTPVIMHGAGLFGYLTSDSTHRSGLITAWDLTLLMNNLNEPVDSPVYSVATVKGTEAAPSAATADNASPNAGSASNASVSTTDSTSRVERMRHETTTLNSMLATKAPVDFAFLMLVFITFALSILLLVLGRGGIPGSRGALIPAVRILWLIVLAFPPATFLMFCLLPAQPSATSLVIAIVAWVAVISFGALLIGWRTKWVNSLIALYALAIIVIVVGQIFGGPLNSPGYLTYDITEGSRYYGMGNEQGALYFGAWITLSGLVINRYPNARGIPAFKKWGYPLGSLILIFIATCPWLGASFGPLVWGFLGCFFSWWLFNGRRVRPWLVALMLLAAFGLALGVLFVDVTLNPASHMNQVIPSMQEGFVTLVTQIAMSVWTYSLELIRDYVPAVVIIFLFFILILLVVLRVLQPGTYREFWQRNSAFRATYSVCFVLAAITFVLEDSGVFTPAVLLIYPVACFVWLICDLHSWHLRILAHDSTEAPITLRELQQRALGLFARDGEAAPHSPLARKTKHVNRSFARAHAREPEEVKASVGRSTATMSAATLLSRATGFVKTWAMAFALGNTILTSAYTIANNLPNMLFELFAGGVLTTAFLPIYLAQLEKHGRKNAASYASNLLSIGAIVLGAIALLATIFAPQVVFTQSFLKSDDFDAQSAIFFFRFFAIQVLFYGVGAIINGLLNAHRNFLWPALGPVFNNIVVIITFFGYPFIRNFSEVGAMAWLAIGTTLGVVALFVVQIPALAKLKIPLRFHVNFKDPALKDTLKMALPA
ncbi:MAG: hypothetical protein LBH56_01645, partial [Coriobacteriales bacterium]|nr:hypothetical protein [Coriobacteriales bacterium]